VLWGEKAPVDEFDNLARQHDAAYAMWKDERHRMAADIIFAQEANKLDKKYGTSYASDPKFAANAVLYGNYAMRQAKDIGPAFAPTGMNVAGLILHEGKYIYNMQKMLDEQAKSGGKNYMREQEDVREFYKNAPAPTKFSAKASNPAAKQQVDAPVSGSLGNRDVPQGTAQKLAEERFASKPNAVFPDTQALAQVRLIKRQRKHLMDYLRKKKNAIAPSPEINKPKTAAKQEKKNLDLAKPDQFRRDRIKPLGAFRSRG